MSLEFRNVIVINWLKRFVGLVSNRGPASVNSDKRHGPKSTERQRVKMKMKVKSRQETTSVLKFRRGTWDPPPPPGQGLLRVLIDPVRIAIPKSHKS